MTNRHLRLPIRAGDNTCAGEPGKFCRYVLTSHFGRKFTCQIFRPDQLLREKGGWLQRWPECVRSEMKGAQVSPDLDGMDPWEIWNNECEKAKDCIVGLHPEDCSNATVEAAERLLGVAKMLAGRDRRRVEEGGSDG